MAKAPNRAFTRDQLIDFALDGEFDGYDRTIDTYIMTLRAKTENLPCLGFSALSNFFSKRSKNRLTSKAY
jgi:DNA-binding response OmpR family regulator